MKNLKNEIITIRQQYECKHVGEHELQHFRDRLYQVNNQAKITVERGVSNVVYFYVELESEKYGNIMMTE